MVENLLQSALTIIDEHNQQVGKSESGVNPGYITNPQDFIAGLKACGGTTVERLGRFSYEDILNLLPSFKVGEQTVRPVALAREIGDLFRQANKTSQQSSRPVSPVSASRMTLRQLVDNFDASEPYNAVGKRLKEEYVGTKRCIIYNDNGTVDVDSTYDLICQYKNGYSEVQTLLVQGAVKPVYRIGERLAAVADENPLYPNRPLRPGEVCDQLNRSWSGIPLEVRQFVRIALETNEIVHSRDVFHDLMDRILSNVGNALNSLRNRYHGAIHEFEKRKASGTLPSLKVALEGSGTPTGGPFSGGKPIKMHK